MLGLLNQGRGVQGQWDGGTRVLGHFSGCRGGPVATVAPSPGVAQPRWLEAAAARVPARQGLSGGPAEGRSHARPPGIRCSCGGEPCQGAVPGSPGGTRSPWPRAAGAGSPEGALAPDDVLPAAPWPAPGALRWALPHLLVSGAGFCPTGIGIGNGHLSLGAFDTFSRDDFREDMFGVSVAFGRVRFGSLW